MKTRICAALTLLLAAVSLNADAIEIVGARSCGSWIEHRTQRILASSDESWLVGFLSGLADGLNKDFLEGSDNASLYLWVDNYCKANPLDGLHTAAEELAKTLMKRRGIKWP